MRYGYIWEKLFAVNSGLVEHPGPLEERLTDCAVPHLFSAFTDGKSDKYPDTELQRRLLALEDLVSGDGEWGARVRGWPAEKRERVAKELFSLFHLAATLYGAESPPEDFVA